MTRPAGARAVTGGLWVDLGQGREDRRSGRIVWRRPPRARYVCTACGRAEGPVTGADAVRIFVAQVRAVHAARCAARRPAAGAVVA